MLETNAGIIQFKFLRVLQSMEPVFVELVAKQARDFICLLFLVPALHRSYHPKDFCFVIEL